MAGVLIVKLYKQNNKLVVYVPFEVIKGLKLEENDEVDFFKFNQNTFLFAKKSDITSLILGNDIKPVKQGAEREEENVGQKGEEGLPDEQLLVLRKLDTLRYQQRTTENVGKLLNEKEKSILNQLISKKFVSVFKKDKSSPQLYGISKQIYDKFLMRKKQVKAQQEKKPVIQFPLRKKQSAIEDENVKKLEEKGFVVINTEGEASTLSLVLEESIRQGMVLGTRAFNKKFYVVLRAFFEKNSSVIIKKLREGNSKVAEIANGIGVEEDGVRGILYLLSESGDVSEKRRDTFALA